MQGSTISALRWTRVVLVGVVAAAGLANVENSARAADEGSWVGREVMLKSSELNLMRGTEKIEIRALQTYKVTAVKDGWLYLVGRRDGTAGYASPEWVVTFDDSLMYFTRLIRENPRDADAYTHRAYVWKAKKEYDIAIQDYNDLLRISPDATAFASRGVIWDLKKRYDQAIADFDEAVRLDPSDPLAYYDRGVAYLHKHEDDKALADFTETIRLDPAFSAAYLERGLVWSIKKDYERALSDYETAMRLNGSGSSEAAWLLATCPIARIRDGKRAVELAKRACTETDSPRHFEFDALAAAYAEAGDFEKAREAERKAIELAARNTAVKKDLQYRLALFTAKKPYRFNPDMP